jgi:hypothetical protein
MCDDTDPSPADQTSLSNVLTRWDDLITNTNYDLTVELQGQKLNTYKMYLFGSQMDPLASNLPMSVANSVVTE